MLISIFISHLFTVNYLHIYKISLIYLEHLHRERTTFLMEILLIK